MTDNQQYIVRLEELKLGEHSFQFELNDAYFSEITPSELLGGQTTVEAKITLRESDFSLRMKIDGEVFVSCDRCLDPMPVAVKLDEDVEDATEEDGEIDLKWLAYELICVNLPLVHSHQPGGCNPAMELLLQSHLCTEPEEPEA